MKTRPALRYSGGKFLAAPEVLRFFPKHDCYVEPYGGGASLLIQKAVSPVEVYNDLDGQVVNFFRILRERPEELIKAINLTPYSRAEYKLSIQPSEDLLESARRLYVRLWQGHGGTLTKDGGWRFIKKPGHNVAGNFENTEHLWAIAKRLKKVQIECDTAENVMRRYDTPETLFLIDPPYLHETRKEKRFYNHEMTKEQHESLCELLVSLEGKVIVCGYISEMYDSHFSDWNRVPYRGRSNGGGIREEILWISPSCRLEEFNLIGLI
jgi:DNA adenine methylase